MNTLSNKALISVAFGAFSLACSGCATAKTAEKTPAEYVNPFIGTSNFGATHRSHLE